MQRRRSRDRQALSGAARVGDSAVIDLTASPDSSAAPQAQDGVPAHIGAGNVDAVEGGVRVAPAWPGRWTLFETQQYTATAEILYDYPRLDQCAGHYLRPGLPLRTAALAQALLAATSPSPSQRFEFPAKRVRGEGPMRGPAPSTTDVCPICWDSLDGENARVQTDCGHNFHETCLVRGFKNTEVSKCPVCRSELEEYVPV